MGEQRKTGCRRPKAGSMRSEAQAVIPGVTAMNARKRTSVVFIG
jgi:hypothetical protein